MKTPPHPLDDLTAAEITAAASTVKSALLSAEDAGESEEIRFSYVTLAEPAKLAMAAYLAGEGPVPARQAEVIATIVSKMDAYVFVVNLGDAPSVASVARSRCAPRGVRRGAPRFPRKTETREERMAPPREETRGRSRGDRTGDGRGSASGVEVRRTVFGAGILALALVPERVAVLRRSHRAL